MALALDASSPSATHSANNTTRAITCTAFSPPAGSVIAVCWEADDSGGSMSTPSITDSLGSHLTYTLSDYSSRNDGTGHGQVAIWTANCPSSQTNMTITVTNNDSNATALDATLRVQVWTGADTTQNGAHGKGGGTAVTGTATYTSTRAGSIGIIGFADWNASSSHPTLQSGCTEDAWGTLAGQSTGWVIRETSAIGSSGSSVTVGASAPSVEGRWAYLEILPAVSAAAATPQPLVVSAPERPRATPPLVLRSTLADPPVLTTKPPLVVTQSAPKALPNQALVVRSSLQDFATPQPIVVSQPTKPVPGTPPVVLRSTLADPPVLTTPPPLVVTQPAVPTLPSQALVVRSSLQDFATPQPIVVSQPSKPVPGTPPVILRSSLADVAVAAQATPQPIVVSQPTKPVPGTPPLVLRSTLADPPVLTTPPPLVVTQPTRLAVPPAPLIARSSLQDLTTPPPLVVTTQTIRLVPTPATIARGSLFDASTPAPLVVAPPAAKPWTAQPVLLRSSLADPVVVTGVASPRPLVITSPAPRPWTHRPLILASVVCDCTTHRPDTGLTTRPDTGIVAYDLSTVARPDTGIVARPDTGIVKDPCC